MAASDHRPKGDQSVDLASGEHHPGDTPMTSPDAPRPLTAVLDDHVPEIVDDYGGPIIQCEARDCGATRYDWWDVHEPLIDAARSASPDPDLLTLETAIHAAFETRGGCRHERDHEGITSSDCEGLVNGWAARSASPNPKPGEGLARSMARTMFDPTGDYGDNHSPNRAPQHQPERAGNGVLTGYCECGMKWPCTRWARPDPDINVKRLAPLDPMDPREGQWQRDS